MLILWIFLNTWRFQGCKIWSLGSNLSMVDVIAFVMLKVSICSLWKLKRTASFCGFVIPVCVFVLTWWAKVKCRYKNQEALRQCIRRWFSSDAGGNPYGGCKSWKQDIKSNGFKAKIRLPTASEENHLLIHCLSASWFLYLHLTFAHQVAQIHKQEWQSHRMKLFF